MLRDTFRQSFEAVRKNLGLICLPVFASAFFEYWISLGSAKLRHAMLLLLWRNYLSHGGNSNRAVPIGICISLLTWFVLFYLGAFAFAAIAIITKFRNRDEVITSLRAYALALNQEGLPSLLWRMFWRIALAGYIVMVISAGIGFALYKFSPEMLQRLTRPPAIILFDAAIYTGFFLYAYRLLLAIPMLISGSENAYKAQEQSIQHSQLWKWQLIAVASVVILLIDNINRFLPSYIVSMSAVPLSYGATVTIVLIISFASSLIAAWFFTFLTLLASREIKSDVKLFGEGDIQVSL